MKLCINLARRKDRKFVTQKIMPDVEFIEAVDGEVIQPCKLKHSRTQSSYAVRLSKLKAIRKFLRSEDETLLLVEDDILILEGFEAALQRALKLKDSFDLFFLGGSHSIPPEPLGDGIMKCNGVFDNHCILMSRSGARKVKSILIRGTHAYSDRDIDQAIQAGDLNAMSFESMEAFQREGASNNFGSRYLPPRLFTGEPWMAADDANVLWAALSPGDTVVEWGAGGSSDMIRSAIGQSGSLFSIEHNKSWSLKTGASHIPMRPDLKQEQWRVLPSQADDYIKAGSALGVAADVILVDGRERVRCLLEAAKFLKPGGFALLHDSYRPRYRAFLSEILSQYEYIFETAHKEREQKAGGILLLRRPL